MKVSKWNWYDKVAIIAAHLKRLEKEVPPPSHTLSHRFEKDLYIRTMCLVADTIFIGRKHLRGHEVHLLKGRAIYITKKGQFEVSAPYSICTAPGFIMVAYIIEDVEVETWHRNPENLRDIDMLEAREFEPAETLITHGQALCQDLPQQLSQLHL